MYLIVKGMTLVLIIMEEWKDVPGFNGKYQVSINTKEGKCRNTNYRGTGKARAFSSKPNKRDGRIRWGLLLNQVFTSQQAAYWIAISFPELVQNEYFPGAQIDHIDGDVLNNHPSNLRWVTPKENTNNSITKALVSSIRKGKTLSGETKKKISKALINNPGTSSPVEQYTQSGEFLGTYPSIAEAIRCNPVLCLSHSKISLCCSGKRKSHKGFIWKYA